MANKNPTHSFAKGNTIAKESNNQARKRIRKSKLRKTLDKLYELEPRALENIKTSVEGGTIDKSVVDTSKWLIQQLQAVSKSAAQDEAEMNGLRWEADKLAKEEQVEGQEELESQPATRFSLHVLPTNKDI